MGRRLVGRWTASYHKGGGAPLSRLPQEAAVDVRPPADQDHDAPLQAVEVLLEQLKHTGGDTGK